MGVMVDDCSAVRMVARFVCVPGRETRKVCDHRGHRERQPKAVRDKSSCKIRWRFAGFWINFGLVMTAQIRPVLSARQSGGRASHFRGGHHAASPLIKRSI